MNRLYLLSLALTLCASCPGSLLAQAIWSGSPNSGKVALTLDDGYNIDWRILDFLEARQIRGTAFLNGEVLENDPELAIRLHALGWEIGPHLYHHLSVRDLSADELRRNLGANQDIIEATIGIRPIWFRPPYGISTAQSERIAAELGMRTVLFHTRLSTGDFLDEWSLAYKRQRMEGILASVQPGDIILAHFGARDSFAMITQTVDGLLARGLRFGTLSEVMQD